MTEALKKETTKVELCFIQNNELMIFTFIEGKI